MPRQAQNPSRRRQQQQQQQQQQHSNNNNNNSNQHDQERSSPPPPPLHPSQQIQHLPSEVFHYEPRHRVMICLWCKCAILDAPFKDHLGTRSHKTYRHLNRYDEFRAYLETFPQRVKKTEEIVITPEPIPVVKGLGDPLYPSYQCTYDRCGYVGMGIPQIKEHCTSRHGWTNPQRRGRPPKKRKLEETEVEVEGQDAVATTTTTTNNTTTTTTTTTTTSAADVVERKKKEQQQRQLQHVPWITVASQQFFPRGRGSQRFRVFTPAEAAAAGLDDGTNAVNTAAAATAAAVAAATNLMMGGGGS
ncbi:hypothetical protein KEM54_003899, partial [Ascosphaera aggregata]